MANTHTEVARHPLAIAWDDWLKSPEGKGCAALQYPESLAVLRRDNDHEPSKSYVQVLSKD